MGANKAERNIDDQRRVPEMTGRDEATPTRVERQVWSPPTVGRGSGMQRMAVMWRGASALVARLAAPAAALAAVLVVALPAGAASAATTTCTGTISSGVLDQSLTIEGDVVVPAGASCRLLNIVIDGDLTVGAGASANFGLFVSRPLGLNGVAGDVRAVRAAELSIAFAHVAGSVTAVQGGTVGLVRSRVANNLVVVGNESVSLFDASVGATATCQNNRTVFVHEFGATRVSGQCPASP